MKLVGAVGLRSAAKVDALLVDGEDGLVEISLRRGKSPRDGERPRDVGTVGVKLAACKNSGMLRLSAAAQCSN